MAHAQSKPPTQADAADNPNCPPNAYCQTEEVGPPAEAQAKPDSVKKVNDGEVAAGEDDSVVVIQRRDGTATVELPPPPPGVGRDAPRTFTYVPPTKGRPGQVIIYDDNDRSPYLPPVDQIDAPPRPPDSLGQPKRRSLRHRRWGLNVRANAALLPRYENSADNHGMFGVGLSLRYRPVRAFALDFGADFLGGRDSNGFERQEMPFSASAVFYPNPRSFAQIYMFGGMNWTLARVFADEPQVNLAGGDNDAYTYIGGHAGAGIELRFTPLFGLSLDAQAYLRTRTDGDEAEQTRFPEYFDPNSGEISNTTIGGLARAGINFWW